MELRSCRRCKKLFNFIGKPICPACVELGEDEFKKVKKYIDEHRGCSKTDIIRDCEVTDKQIMNWLKEERLELAQGVSTGLTCSRCGTPINIGKMCSKCIMEFQNEAQGISGAGAAKSEVKKPVASNSQGMRFIRK